MNSLLLQQYLDFNLISPPFTFFFFFKSYCPWMVRQLTPTWNCGGRLSICCWKPLHPWTINMITINIHYIRTRSFYSLTHYIHDLNKNCETVIYSFTCSPPTNYIHCMHCFMWNKIHENQVQEWQTQSLTMRNF